MAGDPFSSHPYPARKNVVPLFTYCQICEKDVRTIDKAAHERGKKHREKVAANNAGGIGGGEWSYNAAANGKGCHNCNGDHLARDCPEPRKDTRECHFCHRVGHAKADCPDKPRSACHNCGEEGHRKSECTNPRHVTCNNCQRPGHMRRDCPEPENLANFKCNNCENMGHKARECPEPKDWSKVKCSNCGDMGHTIKRCTVDPTQVPPMVVDSSEGWDNGITTEPFGEVSASGNGSWDDTAAQPEAAPTKSWDDTEPATFDAPANTESWGAGNTSGVDAFAAATANNSDW